VHALYTGPNPVCCRIATGQVGARSQSILVQLAAGLITAAVACLGARGTVPIQYPVRDFATAGRLGQVPINTTCQLAAGP
jgi:hypothetical protein